MENISEMVNTSVEVVGALHPDFDQILTEDALLFFQKVHDKFQATRKDLLLERKVKQDEIDNGYFPNFLTSTKNIRSELWTVRPIPNDLKDRRVEITGPVDRKMIINALNSGVKVFMADFEDSNSPTWENILHGQINLRDAANKTISFYNETKNKNYTLNDKTATLMVRPRGWHLEEKNVLINGQPVSASLFDFCLYYYHNAHSLINNGSGPYFYLPKLESHHEARLWNDVFVYAQEYLDIPIGTIKATVLIETILAAFEMDEILYELKDHSAGLNCGRWDYIFSFIKKFRNHSKFTLPDRSTVTMDRHFLNSYVKLLINTCHKRKAHAMGGMAAQIPIKNDETANYIALNKVKIDKEREANAGHDGTWIAHPGLSKIATDAFDSVMDGPHQYDMFNDVEINAEDLLKVPAGEITELGLRDNIKVGLQYTEAWLRGNGCVPLYHLMEDAATAEISRSQIWQWLRHGASLSDGTKITKKLYLNLLSDELLQIKKEIGDDNYNNGKFDLAVDLFNKMIFNEEFDDFLTLPAYEHI